MELVVLILGVILISCKIFDTFENKQPMFECYVLAFAPLIVITILAGIVPAWRSYENFGYFLIYLPLIALFILPFTMIPVAIAHIIYKIKNRKHPETNEYTEQKKADRVASRLLIVGSVLMLLSMLFLIWLYFLGLLIIFGVCIYKYIQMTMRLLLYY
jgi:uncharacterized membrane protein